MTALGGNIWFLMKCLHLCTEARLQCSNGTLCYRLRRLAQGYKTLENPSYVRTAENSYAGEGRYKTGLP